MFVSLYICVICKRYGHEITTHSFQAKLFLCFYFILSTCVVGSIIGHFSNLYIQLKENAIMSEIVDDVTWVHQADLNQKGTINEAEFVMFKLLQLQHYDRDLVLRLSAKFCEYDSECKGRAVIGRDIPSAEQVTRMQTKLEESKSEFKSLGKNMQEDSELLMELWRREVVKRRSTMVLPPPGKDLEEGSGAPPKLVSSSSPSLSEREQKRELKKQGSYSKDDLGDKQKDIEASKKKEDPPPPPPPPPPPTRLHDLDFTWSKRLWKQAAYQTGLIAFTLLVLYLGFGYYVFIYDSEQMNEVQGWYFIAGTLSTVGFGDYAPESQVQRLCSMAMIPFGLIILGFFISFARAYALSIPHKEQKIQDGSIKRIFEQLNIPDDGFITKQQFVDNARFVNMTPKKAEEFFDKLDVNKENKLYLNSYKPSFFDSIIAKFCFILLKIYGTIAIGAIAFKFWPKEDDLSWIDAFYFATVTSTSIGYVLTASHPTHTQHFTIALDFSCNHKYVISFMCITKSLYINHMCLFQKVW
jgi:hypothetical protein